MDTKITCSGYLESVSLYAEYANTMWVDLWEITASSTYILRHSFRVDTTRTGLHEYLPVPGGKVQVESGLMLGTHFIGDARGVAAYADNTISGISELGYDMSQLSRIVNEPIFHAALPIGAQISRNIQTYKRLPAIMLHIGQEGTSHLAFLLRQVPFVNICQFLFSAHQYCMIPIIIEN